MLNTTNLPDIDMCFTNSILSPIPLILLVLFGIIHVRSWYPSNDAQDQNNHLSSRSGYNLTPEIGKVDIWRHASLILGIFWPIIALVFANHQADVSSPTEDEWIHGITATALAFLSLIILRLDIRWRVPNITFLALIWVLSFLINTLELYSRARIVWNSEVDFINTFFFINYCAILHILASLVLFKDDPRQFLHLMLQQAAKQSHPSPEPNANFFSVLYFRWMSKIVQIGYERALKHSDLFNLHPHEEAEDLETLRSMRVREDA